MESNDRSDEVVVAGVGMIPFSKAGRSETYDVMGASAARLALADAGLDYASMQRAYVGYVYGDSTAGQAALYGVGRSGVPIINVNNNCSTGSTALFLAREAVQSGVADCVLALGFEQMTPGALAMSFTDRPGPLDRLDEVRTDIQGAEDGVPFAAQFFGGAGQRHMDLFGTSPETFAQISVKARKHAANNPNAVFRDPITLEGVLGSPSIYQYLTRLQCCPPTSGAAAAVVCSQEFARGHGLDGSVRIRAQALTTDGDRTFDSGDMRDVVGYDMTERAATSVYEMSGVNPVDVPVVELHDCFTANELISYEALGLTVAGGAEKFILAGDNTYGGQTVVNPSGGLLSKGHPLGATGLAQCAELVWQLRGVAGARQVEGATLGLQHNVGLGGASVVTLFERVGVAA